MHVSKVSPGFFFFHVLGKRKKGEKSNLGGSKASWRGRTSCRLVMSQAAWIITRSDEHKVFCCHQHSQAGPCHLWECVCVCVNGAVLVCLRSVCVCVWWGVDVCWTALTVRPFQAYITEPSGLFPIATLAEVKGYVPLVCTPTVTAAASASLCSSP